MNEQLLKAITRLFAIVAKERVTDAERVKIREFLNDHIDADEIPAYLEIFDEFSSQKLHFSNASGIRPGDLEIDESTEEFVEDWANIVLICKHINMELTEYQKIVTVIKIIELVLANNELSERQKNLLYYIGQLIKLDNHLLRNIQTFIVESEIAKLSSKNILIIDDGSEENYFDCKHLEVKNLTGFISILYIPKIETYLLKYLGISPIRLNGLPVKSRSISVFPPGSNIRGDKIESIFYSDVAGKFNEVEPHMKLVLEAKNISYKFRQGAIGLRNINITEESGKLIGVMGSSGSGKSLLFEVLSGKRNPHMGKVTINGKNVHTESRDLQGIIGFVPQDDMLIEDLTVFQNMYYAARLSTGDPDEETLNELVNKTLISLGLYDIRDLKVGNPLKKTISGGQRKRLNIGLELLREPSILFLDEPTSGLSSRDSENIMDLLKELALRDKMVFTILHQPSSDIFKMLDSLLILDIGGYQIYYGIPIEAVIYFKNVIKMVNRDQGACITCGNVKVEQIFSIIETRSVDEYGRFTERRKISPRQWNEYFLKNYKAPKPVATGKISNVAQFAIPNRWKQFKAFWQRDLLAKVSNRQYMVINLLEAPVLAFILAYFVRYYDISYGDANTYTFYDNPNIPAYFFMSIIVALFMGLTVSAEEILKDSKILERERFLNLSKSSYLSSKVFILFGVSAIQTFFFVLIGDMILGIRGMHISYWFMLFTCSCTSNMVGLNISSAFNSAITIYILIPIILIPQLIFSGVVFPFDKLNPDISKEGRVPWYGELMASRWAFEAIMVRQFTDNRYNQHFYDIDKKIAQAEYKLAYYIPRLQTMLKEINPGLSVDSSLLHHNLHVVQHEIKNELELFGTDKLPEVAQLVPGSFDINAYQKSQQFLTTAKKVYIERYNDHKNTREDISQRLTNGGNDPQILIDLKQKYHNEQIGNMVKNSNQINRIVETENRLVRKIHPVYFKPEISDRNFNFRAHFYAPLKYFSGRYFETYYFNISVLWVMCMLMWAALYFDLLKRIVVYFEKVSDTSAQYRRNKYYLAKAIKRQGLHKTILR